MASLVFTAIVVSLIVARVSQPDMVTFSTASGSNDIGGDPVSATATFTTGTGTVTIDLKNLQRVRRMLDSL